MTDFQAGNHFASESQYGKNRPRSRFFFSASIAKQFFQLLARRGFALVRFTFWRPNAADKFKILAEISDGFLQNRFGPTFAALMRDARVVTCAIQTNAQIRATFHADFAATGISRRRPRFAAIVAMARHLNLRFMIYDL
jgi:hypothetical protein